MDPDLDDPEPGSDDPGDDEGLVHDDEPFPAPDEDDGPGVVPLPPD
jgi:hypothetical protein